MKTIKGFKAFNKGLKCRDKQYQENQVFKEEGEVELCNKGMHFCEMPLDVLNYYNSPSTTEYAEVEASGKVLKDGDKSVTNNLKIKSKISFTKLFKLHFDLVFNKVKINKNTTNTSGNNAHANTSGYNAHANTSGDNAHANTSGYDSIASALGINSKVKVIRGWLIIVDWQYKDKWIIKNIYSKKVGQTIKGTKIKPNVWYWFNNGELKSKQP